MYTDDYDVADPNARAAMFEDFLTSSGNYYIAVFGVDGAAGLRISCAGLQDL